jgi:hypothetical protein
MNRVARFALKLLIVILQAALVVWTLCIPLAWLLRDGLGPDSRESGWAEGLCRFAVEWGVPALALVVPLLGVMWLDRRVVVKEVGA